MDKGIYTSLSGAIANEKQLETTANNIANVNTVAFKKDSPVFKEYITKLEKLESVIDVPRDVFKPSDFYHLHGNERSYVALDDITTDFSKGDFKMTSNPFDFAIAGNAFFEVNTPLGIRYTQAGNFTLNSEGKLVTLDGYPVLSERTILNEGEESRTPASTDLAIDDPKNLAIDDPKNREILVNKNLITVRPDGSILSNNEVISKLSLIEFVDGNKELIKAGANMFVSLPNPKIKNETKASVLQGYIERSNVNPTVEMISLINTQRVFDGTNKVISAYSDMATKAIELSDINK